MPTDQLVQNLESALSKIPLIDPHSHLDPLNAASKSLDDILGYHYYTELAHSAGMSHAPLGKDVPPRERVREIVKFMDRYDNTAQYGWFVDIARTFLGLDEQQTKITAVDADRLFDAAQKIFAQPDWEAQVFAKTRLEKIFLTNEFDDPLTDFDTSKYVPCLRTDTLVFHMDKPQTRRRLHLATGIHVHDGATLRRALVTLFLHFTRNGAKACAISLPPTFHPAKFDDEHFYEQMEFHDFHDLAPGIFWEI